MHLDCVTLSEHSRSQEDKSPSPVYAGPSVQCKQMYMTSVEHVERRTRTEKYENIRVTENNIKLMFFYS